MRVALVGCGRMGKAIGNAAVARGHEVVARVVRGPAVEVAEACAGTDVAFEFTEPAAAEANVAALVGRGVSTVCGTTGWTPGPELSTLAEKRGAGLIVAPNFSLGVQMFYRLVGEAARCAGKLRRYDAWVHERHHRAKRDAPSGTARRLADLLRPAFPELAEPTATRAGHEPGLHTVGLDGPEDAIELTHAARGREGFAVGAVVAAEWLVGRSGVFSFEQVVEALLSD